MILSLGRPAWTNRPCRRGDLVSQRGEESNPRWESSFDRSEGEYARRPDVEAPRRTGKGTLRGSGAANGDLRGTARHLELADQYSARARRGRCECCPSLRGTERGCLASRGRDWGVPCT